MTDAGCFRRGSPRLQYTLWMDSYVILATDVKRCTQNQLNANRAIEATARCTCQKSGRYFVDVLTLEDTGGGGLGRPQ